MISPEILDKRLNTDELDPKESEAFNSLEKAIDEILLKEYIINDGKVEIKILSDHSQFFDGIKSNTRKYLIKFQLIKKYELAGWKVKFTIPDHSPSFHLFTYNK
jgi:hypothetical protein